VINAMVNARDIEPGDEVITEGVWAEVEVVVAIRRQDGSERVEVFGSRGEEPFSTPYEADEVVLVKRP
jgi:hypothetical protein